MNIIKLIIETQEEYQAQYGCNVATNEDVLAKENCLDIIKLITKSENVKQAKTRYILIKEGVLNKDNYLDIISSVPSESLDQNKKQLTRK